MILYRNFRYRHPLSENMLNDYFDDIMYELIQLLGINNNITEENGIIIKKILNIDDLEDLEIRREDFVEPKLISRLFIDNRR